MKPFFTFFGGKWRAAPRYPIPLHENIIEPFAGAAGYSVRHYKGNVTLIEKDPVIAALWRYLISATPEEILALPLIETWQSVDDLDILPEERSLIGFWLNKGCNGPRKTPSHWMRKGTHNSSFWGKEIRDRIASQVSLIKHWKIIEGNYTEIPNIVATWFIDPPYIDAGRIYKCSSRDIDYELLARWCSDRYGQVIVCEQEGAKWLPFKPYLTIKSTEGKRGKAQSKEAIWINN